MKKIFPAISVALIIYAAITGCATTEPEPEPAVEQPAPVKTAPEPVIEPVQKPEEFIVTEELYVETFEDIRSMIENLNSIIAAKDYSTWRTYLTDDYIDYYSSSEQLEYFSDLYKQRGYTQRIISFEDYFNYVVVLSRRNAVVDEINFTDSTHITAFTQIKDQLTVLYYLEKNENEWKIGLKPEN